MKTKIILIGCFLFFSYMVFAQSDYQQFHLQSQSTNNKAMMLLSGWAMANIVIGAYCWNKYSGQIKYFHQMNLFWNCVNLSIAGFALYQAYSLDCSLLSSTEIITKHLKTEKILLINAAIDVGYIGTGFLLQHFSTQSKKRGNLLFGYGSSLLLQGGFLLAFDLCLYSILRHQRLEFFQNINLSVSPDFTGMLMFINF